jgi:ribose 5-phosphate isomerase B
MDSARFIQIQRKISIFEMQTIQPSKIFIASDHAGFLLKDSIFRQISRDSFDIVDLGCNSPDISVDYPDIAKELASKVMSNPNSFGILICGSGIGVSIAANRFPQIRAALCHSIESAKLARKHNDANVICLGARLISKEIAFAAVEAFLATNFEGGRHEGRVSKLS